MKVTITRKVDDVNLSAGDWQLYTVDPKNRAASNQAAKALNKAFTKAVNAGLSRNAVEDAVFKVQCKHCETGATDTEPRYVLRDLLDKVFGPEE